MIFRVQKTKDYVVMSNYHLRDKSLSLKAKGLLSWMLSNNDDWDYSIAGIVSNCKENETAIKSALDELKEHNYLIVKKYMPGEHSNNRIEYEYIVYEKPQEVDSQGVENLVLENQELENQELENQVQRNNKNNKYIKERNIKENKKDISQKPFSKGFLKHSKQKEFKIDGLVDMYNSICINLPKVRALTDKRKTSVEKLYKKYDFDTFKKVFEIANTSSFLTGDNDRGWKADFDWLLQEEKFIRVLEGKYDGRRKKQDKFADEGLATCLTRKEPRKEIDKNVKRKTY